jgi:hypothetical protein
VSALPAGFQSDADGFFRAFDHRQPPVLLSPLWLAVQAHAHKAFVEQSGWFLVLV